MTWTDVQEFCREWVDEKGNYCYEDAEVILWGKLFPPEALGPRCWTHGNDHVDLVGGLNEAIRQQWAIFDLRKLVCRG